MQYLSFKLKSISVLVGKMQNKNGIFKRLLNKKTVHCSARPRDYGFELSLMLFKAACLSSVYVGALKVYDKLIYLMYKIDEWQARR